MSNLFSPLRIGRINVPNRLIMAPMTRSRANDSGVPTPLVSTYYAQRASAGLIISEGVFPEAMGKGYVRTPGIETPEQIASWRHVTDAVHAQGGHIFMQMMHCGRISHPSMLPGNALPIAPSTIKPSGRVWTSEGQVDFVIPRALSTHEVAQVIEGYRTATRRALEAGFDGVELHNASGYLPEQFLSSGSNTRDDIYGGSVENRCRFTLEVLSAMIAEAGSDRVGIKLSPEMNFNDIVDANPQETYTYLVKQLSGLDLAYLHIGLIGTSVDYHALLRPLYKGVYVAGGSLNQKSAEAMISDRICDAAVFGTAFLANPDLVERFRIGAELNQPDRNTFYTEGAHGFTDYPALTD